MRVQFNIPVESSTIIKEEVTIHWDDFSFHFIPNSETTLLQKLTIVVHNVPAQKWPTLISADQIYTENGSPKFPFDVNPNAFTFSDIRDNLELLSGLLSLFGVYNFDYSRASYKWLSDTADEFTGLLGGATQERMITGTPVNSGILAASVAVLGKNDPQLAALSHYRNALSAYHNNLNCFDAIRYGYLFLEHLFANGKHKKKQAVQEFRSSDVLCSHCFDWCRKYPSRLKFFKEKYPASFVHGTDIDGLIDLFFRLRGEVLHASKYRNGGLSYARQHDLRHETEAILHICESIARQKVAQAYKCIRKEQIS